MDLWVGNLGPSGAIRITHYEAHLLATLVYLNIRRACMRRATMEWIITKHPNELSDAQRQGCPQKLSHVVLRMQKAALHSNDALNRNRNTLRPSTPQLCVLLRWEAIDERYALLAVDAFLCAITATGISREALVKFDVGECHFANRSNRKSSSAQSDTITMATATI